MSEDKTTTQKAMEKAQEAAQEIKDAQKTKVGMPMKGTDKNPVQVATEDLKMGVEKGEEELREKTEHVGRIASNVTAKAKEATS